MAPQALGFRGSPELEPARCPWRHIHRIASCSPVQLLGYNQPGESHVHGDHMRLPTIRESDPESIGVAQSAHREDGYSALGYNQPGDSHVHGIASARAHDLLTPTELTE